MSYLPGTSDDGRSTRGRPAIWSQCTRLEEPIVGRKAAKHGIGTAEADKLQWEVEEGVVAGYLPWAIALGGVSGWAPWRREKHSLVPGGLGDLLLHAGLRNAAPVTASRWRMRLIAVLAGLVIVAFETWFIKVQVTGW